MAQEQPSLSSWGKLGLAIRVYLQVSLLIVLCILSCQVKMCVFFFGCYGQVAVWNTGVWGREGLGGLVTVVGLVVGDVECLCIHVGLRGGH